MNNSSDNDNFEFFKNAFIVYSNTDLIEGRGVEYARDICLSEITANRLSKGTYIQRTDCPIHVHKIFKYNKLYYGPILLIRPTIADQQEQLLIDTKHKKEVNTQELLDKIKASNILDDKEFDLLITYMIETVN